MAEGASVWRLSRVYLLAILTGLALAGRPSNAEAQPPVSIEFKTPRSGDCAVQITMAAPLPAPLSTFRLLRDENETDALPREIRSTPGHASFEFALRNPLLANSQLTIDYLGFDGAWHRTPPTTVQQSGHFRTTCRPYDERLDFEAAVFSGVVADTFAPNTEPNVVYNNTGNDLGLKASMAVAFEGQLHLFPGDQRWWNHIWLTVDAIYGVRGADLNCSSEVDKKSPLCDLNQPAITARAPGSATISASVLRATRLGTAFVPRYELFTVNKDGTAITFFVAGRMGFNQFPDEPKPANNYGAGGGLLFPGGPFRDSHFMYTLGKDEAYRTHPAGKRSRMDFRFVFNMLPTWKDQIPFLAGVSQSVRGLITVIVDRNFFGPGPDVSQTYLGVVVDIRRLLGGN